MEYIVLLTIANTLLLMVLAFLSGKVKRDHGLRPFDLLTDERARIANRIHENTVENTVLFLPLLWLAATYGNARMAAVLGLIWLLSRIAYAFAYAKKPASRSAFFAISLLALLGLIGCTVRGLWF